MSFNPTKKDMTSATCGRVMLVNHPSPTPGAKINKGLSNGGAVEGDRTGYRVPPTSGGKVYPGHGK